ncbi:MAG: hypothetical protein IZT55_04930 [Anaerolineae bacterium]|nr:hypothetical protein [Anaerolineae bacterium]
MKSNPNQKMKVIVNNQSYSVNISEIADDLLAVTVDGRSYQIQIQPEYQLESNFGITKSNKKKRNTPGSTKVPNDPEFHPNEFNAPLPGNITEIMVKEGDTVEVDQVLCVIEAMKMKNLLRSPRNGRIANVEVSLGETVPYNKTLIRFA